MSEQTDFDRNLFCTATCWAISALASILACVILIQLIGFGYIGAIFVAAILFVILGIALTRIFCSDLEHVKVGAHDIAGGSVPPPPPSRSPAQEKLAESASSVGEAVSDTASAAGEVVAEKATAAKEAVAEKVEAAKDATAQTTAKALDAAAAPLVKASTALKGEDDLKSRKGEWSYKSGDAAPAKPSGEDYDGDGVVEGTDEGTKPATLDGARDGKPDDLKQIKGVGPKMEKLLNSLGFYHFDQVASWTDQEVAWVDANLEGFKGRVSRDEWVAQAKVLAEGGETEFSKRVEDGDVY